MKKVLLIASALIIGFNVSAQVSSEKLTVPVNPNDIDFVKDNFTTKNNTLRRAPNSGIFTPDDANFASMGVDASTTPNTYLFPDSAAKIIFTNGEGFIRFHTFGQTFDPKFEWYELTNAGFKTTRFMSYNLDSIRFSKGYYRTIDSFDFGSGMAEVVDTLFIEYHKNTGMSTFTQGVAPNFSNVIALPNINTFSTSKLTNTAAFKRDTILLTKASADSLLLSGSNSSLFRSSLTIPVTGFNVAATNNQLTGTKGASLSGVIATTLIYKPAVPFTAGDTLLDFEGSGSNVKKNNVFALVTPTSTGAAFTSDAAYNSSYTTSWEVKYGQTVLNVVRSYIPGSAYTSYRGSSIDYYITIPNYNVGINKLKENGITIGDAYPNPSNVDQVNIPVKSATSIKAGIMILDINGKMVYNSSEDILDENIKIDISNLNAGLYTISISIDGMVATKKISVN